MTRFGCALVLFGVLAIAVPRAHAQGGGGGQQQPPAPMTNLQIFPKDTPRQQVIAAMQNFVQSLGLQGAHGGCSYCHVGQGPQADYASDAKPQKNVARKMILMTRELAGKLPEITGKAAADVTPLRCVTCHRGVPIPKLLPDVITETITKQGVAAGVQQYRDLRKQFYGGQSYDFREGSLVTVAQQMNAASKPDDALAVLQVNAELYPTHAPTYGMMAQAYGLKKDTANQIKSLEKAVELDPNNQQLKRQLDQLKAPR